jgi:hypothetical protein
MPKRKVPVQDVGTVKKLRLRDTLPGQVHFPEISHPPGLFTIILLVALAIAASLVVWWLKS